MDRAEMTSSGNGNSVVVRSNAECRKRQRRQLAREIPVLRVNRSCRELSPPVGLGYRGGQHSGKLGPSLSAGREAVKSEARATGGLRSARAEKHDTVEGRVYRDAATALPRKASPCRSSP